MSGYKYIDRICAVVMAFAVVLTVLFMNGSRFGLQVSADADAEAHSDDTYFTDNDLNAAWDTSGATQILLEGDTATISGSGCYLYENDVVIAQSGKYVVSGSLTGGSIVVSANENSKVWILFDGVQIECEDDACLIVDEADKVFLTLAEGTENSLASGDTYSEEARADNTDGAIFAHDDLTINGTGSLSVTAGYKHGIAANDDLVITGGTITVTAAKDGIHANDSLRITEAVLNITAQDDGLAVDNENAYVYIESGDFTISCADEGIYAPGDITIAGGSFTITTGTEQGHHGMKAGGTCTVTDGSILIDACYEGIQAHFIDIQGGDLTIYSTDDGLNASVGGSTEGMGAMGGQMMDMGAMTEGGMGDFQPPQGGMQPGSEMPAMGEGQEFAAEESQPASVDESQATSADESQSADAETMDEDEAISAQDTQQNGQMPAMGEGGMPAMEGMTEGEEGSLQPPQGDMQNGQMPGMGGQMSGTEGGQMPGMESMTETEEDGTSETEELSWLHISGGNILIVNENAMDADGLDSNGDILISGGTILVSLSNSGSNNAIDYASESGGVCEITGGTVIACGSYAMAEGFGNTSTQGSILYSVSSGMEAGTEASLLDKDGNELLSWEVPCSFSAVTFSCPEMTVGETYTIVIGDSSEDVELSEIAISSGDSQSTMFGGTFNMGGGMQGGQMPDMEGMTEGEESSLQTSQDNAQSTDGAQNQGEMQNMEGMQMQGAGPDMQEADTAESEDDASMTESSSSLTAEECSETLIQWAVCIVILAAALLFVWRYRR